MPTCISIISSEGVKDGWIHRVTDDDVSRILARYKEHVSFWNIGIDVIRGELSLFANALQRDYHSIATKFDSLPPKRILREQPNPDFDNSGNSTI